MTRAPNPSRSGAGARPEDEVREPVYLVLGDDPTLRSDAVRALVGELLGGDDPTLALEDFTLDAAAGGSAAESPAALAAALNAAVTPPFGTERRVIVLREIGLLAASDAESLTRYLADPLSSTALVLVAGGGRIPVALTKAVKAVGGKELRTSEETGAALNAAMSRAHVSLTPSAARQVTEWLGDDVGRVPALLELLRSAYGEDALLDVGDIEPYLGEAGSVAPFHLTGAIDRGEIGGAIEVLHRLRGASFHPLQVMTLLHRHYQRLLRLDDPSVTTEAEAMAALGGKVKPYPAKLALRQAQLLGRGGIRAAYGHLAKADVDLRGATGAPEDAVLEILVGRLAGLSRRVARPTTPTRRPRSPSPRAS